MVESLLERGLVSAGNKVISGPGQPSIPIDLSDHAAFSFGISVRQDGFSLILMDIKGKVIADHSQAIPMEDRSHVLGLIKETVNEQIISSKIDANRVFGIGVAMSGFFLEGGHSINTPKSMGDWALRDLEPELSEIFGLPVWVENDGNAAAVGENLYGIGREVRNFAFVYMDYGLGGGIIQNGQLLRGTHGNAGEFTGLLEPHLRSDRPTLTLLLEMLNAHGAAFDSVSALLEGFSMELPGVADWLQRTRKPLTHIVSTIAAIFDPQAIVLGGRLPQELSMAMAAQAEFFYVPVREIERPFPKVLSSALIGDRAATGAAAIPFTYHFF